MVAKPAQQGTTLTLADRIAYQRAIEEVYWRHRIWPKERPDPKPPLDEVMSSAQLEKKVEDYLRNSQALEDYWQRPITAEQLQAEMDRMAQHTKQPEVLRELFEALGNDPFVIAECLARPALSERLLTNFYANDQRFHGELRQRAEAELQTHHSVREMKQLSGNYREIEWVRSDSEEIVGQASRLPNEQLAGEAPGLRRQDSTGGLTLTSREWDENVQKLTAMFGNTKNGSAQLRPARPGRRGDRGGVAPIAQIKTGLLSPLQEDDGRYYATAIVKKTKDRLRFATVEWRKEPLEFWRAKAENEMPKVMAAVSANYKLPTISGMDAATECTNNTWIATASPPDGRGGHTAVWTGSEMIVWGGVGGGGVDFNTGGKYNPSTDSWTTTSTTNAPSARGAHTAVWTGSEMIIWGGSFYDTSNHLLNTGGRYNPGTDSWAATSTTNAPSARTDHTAVWTGSQMIVWGGAGLSDDLNTGGRYNPGTDSWAATSTANAPAGRSIHTAVWTGSEMIIWGGYHGGNDLNTGGRYNPGTNSWTATSTTNAPSPRDSHTAVWTGSEMIVWGGTDTFNNYFNTGGGYNPSTDSWTAISTSNAPVARTGHTAVWTGSKMIIWGGASSGGDVTTGGRYSPGTDSWTATSTSNAPTGRIGHTAVWTGSQMIVWGGSNSLYLSPSTGGRYNPSTDSWTSTSTANAPSARSEHTAVWTGSEMIVWGGIFFDGSPHSLNTGGRYHPGTDTWTATSTANAPSARHEHTAVWTGSEMIVWGGFTNFGNIFNTGSRYNPSTNSWTATSTINAPSARVYHAAVWTGSEMIIWGGYFFDGINDHYLNTGGRYNPGTNSWTATSTTNAPSGREFPTAVWTGSEIIVWGGFDGSGGSFTGGRYIPVTNSWMATSTTNAPTARSDHTAIWSGSEMIIWGGSDNVVGDVNTGGRYNPGTNTWMATGTSNAPTARSDHTAIWTGSEMIVWGGVFYDAFTGSHYLNSGGRFNPSTNSWTGTSANDAPTGRVDHTAVWTGSEMIVWGGEFAGAPASITSTGGRYCAQPPSALVQLGNISTRAFVQTGDNVMIGGFIITGTGQKRVIVRAIGPSLAQHGITNPLQNPTLELHDHTGAVIASNDNWMNAPNRQEIINSGLAPGNNLESASCAESTTGPESAWWKCTT